jgi:hypothetical protein
MVSTNLATNQGRSHGGNEGGGGSGLPPPLFYRTNFVILSKLRRNRGGWRGRNIKYTKSMAFRLSDKTCLKCMK